MKHPFECLVYSLFTLKFSRNINLICTNRFTANLNDRSTYQFCHKSDKKAS